MVKRGISNLQLTVLDSLALFGEQNIQGIQLREGLNYASTNRSVKMLERLSFIWMSHRNESRGPKGAQIYSLTPLGVVEALLRGNVRDQVNLVTKHWGKISPRYVHHWRNFDDAGLVKEFWKCLWRLYPERVIVNRIVPLDVHEVFRSYIKEPNFPAIRDGFDFELLDMFFRDYSISRDDCKSFMDIVSSDPEFYRVWNFWFYMQQNKFRYLRNLETGIKRRLRKHKSS